ncbi:MAG TPA: hypothetical protein VJK03_02270 [Candidatus Nanoarchaeia archaeon]|nr:hypothetical protein [Candidatus Nanoarchaeia archaeon]
MAQNTVAEVYIIIPERQPGFLSDTSALKALSRIHGRSSVDVVTADPSHPYPLVIRLCKKEEIDFRQEERVLQEKDFDKLISSYGQVRESPHIVYLTQGRRQSRLEGIAHYLAKKGHQAEIRKLF